MEQNSNTNRLHALDGLRGLAMILVFLDHINSTYILKSFPFVSWLGIFASGIVGVSFFFILSGFLMYYLYPLPADNTAFLQKRYTRIFPLFITMTAVMLAYYIYPDMAWYIQLAVIPIFAIISNAFWVHGVKKINNFKFSRFLFYSFLILQILIGGIYVFWIMRHPPIYFNQQIPTYLKNFAVGFVNATLTFPFGNYIPLLDGVYWSLAAEILFYILYPILVVPIVWLLIPQIRKLKILFIILLPPFFAALDILSHHLLSLSTYQVSLFYYFIVGITLAYLFKNYKDKLFGFSKIFKGKFYFFPIILFILFIICEQVVNILLPDNLSPWIRLFSAFPFGFLVAVALDETTYLSKFFNSKLLVFIGTISYSLYLSHTAVIKIISEIIQVNNLLSNLLLIVFAFILDLVIGFALYRLLERPYFLKSTKASVAKQSLKIIEYKRAKFILGGLLICAILAIFLAFQSNFNFSSVTVSYTQKNGGIKKLTSYSHTRFYINSSQNNLGIILLKINHIYPKVIKTPPPLLTFKLTDATTGSTIISTDYVFDEFKGELFPFGIPNQPNSKNKKYIADLFINGKVNSNYLTVDSNNVQAVYQIDKKTLFKNPREIIDLFSARIINVFSNLVSFEVFLLILPLSTLSFYIILQRKKIKPNI